MGEEHCPPILHCIELPTSQCPQMSPGSKFTKMHEIIKLKTPTPKDKERKPSMPQFITQQN